MSCRERGFAELPAGVEPFLDRKEAASFLRCSLAHVDRMMRELGLPYFNIGPPSGQRKLPRFCPSELRLWAKARQSTQLGPQVGEDG